MKNYTIIKADLESDKENILSILQRNIRRAISLGIHTIHNDTIGVLNSALMEKHYVG